MTETNVDERSDATYPALKLDRLEAGKPFRHDSQDLHVNVLDFWQWSASDLVSNLTRGRLAEFIVAHAAGVDVRKGVRNEWDPFDFTINGVKVEVKSAAYLQSWHQRHLSNIVWRVGPTRRWDASTNTFEPEARWQADVYVFALFEQKNKTDVDPLDVARWRFFVVPVRTLRDKPVSDVLTLSALTEFAGEGVGYYGIRAAIEAAKA